MSERPESNDSVVPPTQPQSDSLADGASTPGLGTNPYRPPSEVASLDDRERSFDVARLKKTRVGLTTVYCGICTVLTGVLFGVFLGVAGAFTDSTAVAIVGAVVMSGGVLGGFVAMIVGQIFCLTVPQESGGRGYVLATITLQVVTFLMPILNIMMMRFMVARINQAADPQSIETMLTVSQLLNFLQMLVALATFLCFVLFLRKLAGFVSRPDLASTASGVLKMTVASIVMLPILGILTSVTLIGGVNGFIAAPIVTLIFALFVLVTFIRYVNLIRNLAKAIS